ncbi:RNA polymerase I-specific transcription initiation factor RRN3 [Ramaria rubella]|nr:RNA polymerase I-specific transcription initiation factor RRN3 [Ramaria rubella]
MFHSNSSPFNHRQPKAGPSTVQLRHYQDSTQKPDMLAEFPKRNSTAFKESMVTPRPIATNSRVKRDEKYRQDMYLAFVNNALLQKSKGVIEPFEELVNLFNSKSQRCGSEGPGGGTSAAQLRLWMSALSHVVSQLERTHSALVNAVINMPWTAMDPSFVKAYVAFIGMLVSARPEYLSLVLEKIARGFTFRSGVHAVDSTSEGSWGPLTRRIVYDRLHNLLEHLLSLIPTLPSTLQPLLVRHFPHKRQEKADQITYIRNLLRITEYCPALADRILSTIIDRAIQIDVEIQVEMEELEVDEGTRNNGEIFLLDPFDTIVGQEGSDSEGEEEDDDGDNISDLSSDAGGDPDDDESPAEIEQDLAHVREMVEKLDAMLKLLFDHFHRTHSGQITTLRSTSRSHDPPKDISSTTSPSRPPPTLIIPPEHGRDLRRSQFMSLLSIFDRTIIRTFKSRYTQFLVFWYSSLDPEFTDMFQGMLVSKALFEDSQPIVTRAAAASYIASFVSRAQFVLGDSAKRVMALLCDFLATHLELCATMGDTFDPHAARHTLFYAVAQAAFLIFCFRWRDLQADDELEMDDLAIDPSTRRKWMPKLDIMQRVVTSDLNPLKVCSPNVVQQFARVAQSTGFIYCYTILENNRRLDSRGSASSSPHKPSNSTTPASQSQQPLLLRDAADADLNTFFPFDPYKLPLSYSYIQGIYREWAAVALDDEEDEDEDEEQENVEVDSSTREPWVIQGGIDDDTGLGTSFGGMSISPVRPDLLRPSSLVIQV